MFDGIPIQPDESPSTTNPPRPAMSLRALTTAVAWFVAVVMVVGIVLALLSL